MHWVVFHICFKCQYIQENWSNEFLLVISFKPRFCIIGSLNIYFLLAELLRVIRRLNLKEQWTDLSLHFITLYSLRSTISENTRAQNHFRSIGGLEVLLDGLGLPSSKFSVSKQSFVPSDERYVQNQPFDVGGILKFGIEGTNCNWLMRGKKIYPSRGSLEALYIPFLHFSCYADILTNPLWLIQNYTFHILSSINSYCGCYFSQIMSDVL